ncbi:MAG: cyclic nucleotide-binding domain-containing protein [SAR324 cluster bacterium]|nr:cyclic nucleotide-binding domain-containing protein [SAR324 cluster bacterium]
MDTWVDNTDAHLKGIVKEHKEKSEQIESSKITNLRNIVATQKRKIEELEKRASADLKKVFDLENKITLADSVEKSMLKSLDEKDVKIRDLEDKIRHQPIEESPEIIDPKRQQLYNLIKDQRAFQHMSDRMLRILVKRIRTMKLKKGTVVIKEKSVSSYVYLLLRGRVLIIHNNVEIYEMNRIGDIFGELSMISRSPAGASVVAGEDLEVMIISPDMLKRIGDKDFYEWLLRVIAEKLQRTTAELTTTQKEQFKNEHDLILDVISGFMNVQEMEEELKGSQGADVEAEQAAPQDVEEGAPLEEKFSISDLFSRGESGFFSIETYEEPGNRDAFTEIVIDTLKKDQMLISVQREKFVNN